MRALLASASLALAGCTFGGGGILPFEPPPAARVSERDLEVPFVATPRPVVAAMLDMAEVGPEDYVIDLGSGDGRISIAAAQRGARALGVDIDPNRVSEAVLAAQVSQVEGRARFRRQDLFATPIGEASVVSMYLMPEINMRLRPRLLTELRPGARVVSHAFAMGDWRPDEHRDVNGANVYLWIVPAPVGGEWTFSEGGERMALSLDQRFQDVTGTLGGRPLRDVTLRGARISFTLDGPNGPRTLRGIVDGAIIEPERGAPGGWRAQRNA